jgi:hypothetical protein
MLKQVVLSSVVVGMLGTASSQALAKSVCYLAENFDSFIRLDIKPHSLLTSKREHRRFESPIQITYSAHGNIIFDSLAVEPISGTITVAKDVGARSGFSLPLLFPNTSDRQFVSIDCYSEEASPAPEVWQCRGLTLDENAGVRIIPDTFVRVNPLEQERCSFFALPAEEAEEEDG